MKNKLYKELSRYNVFDVNGYQCTNGCRSALVSKDLMFKCGNFGYITPLVGSRGGKGDPDCIVDYKRVRDKFMITYKGGHMSVIKARNVELPQPIHADEVNELADVRLVDEKNSYVYKDGSVCLALDLDRLDGKQWHRVILGSLKAFEQTGMVVGQSEQIRRIEPVILTGSMELALMDIDKHEIISDSMKVDISSLADYVADLVEKCRKIYNI